MELEISKRYSTHSFHLMLFKLYVDIDYDGGYKLLPFLSNWSSFKFFYGHSKF